MPCMPALLLGWLASIQIRKSTPKLAYLKTELIYHALITAGEKGEKDLSGDRRLAESSGEISAGQLVLRDNKQSILYIIRQPEQLLSLGPTEVILLQKKARKVSLWVRDESPAIEAATVAELSRSHEGRPAATDKLQECECDQKQSGSKVSGIFVYLSRSRVSFFWRVFGFGHWAIMSSEPASIYSYLSHRKE